MNKQTFVLVTIIILALGLGIMLSQSPPKDKFEARFLFDDLQEYANQVNSVEIINTQGVLFSAKKSAVGWQATFTPGQPAYPIFQDKLAEFVQTMMRVKLVEAKTNKPKNYIHLGLQPIDIEDSLASLVILKTPKKSWQVLVGNKVTLGEGQYILKQDDFRSWRTDVNIDLPLDRFSWLKQPVLPYQAEDIRSISRVDSLGWKITKSVGDDFYLVNMPKDTELAYPRILNSIVSSLTSLNFEQLLHNNQHLNQPLKILTQLEVITHEDSIFKVVVSGLKDKYFVNFTSTDQSQYWQKWYYQISYFSAQQLIKTTDDFLSDKNALKSPMETNLQVVAESDPLN